MQKLHLGVLIGVAVIGSCFALLPTKSAHAMYVRSHLRSNGTYVNSYSKSAPNAYRYDNYSYRAGSSAYNKSYYAPTKKYSSSWYTPYRSSYRY